MNAQDKMPQKGVEIFSLLRRLEIWTNEISVLDASVKGLDDKDVPYFQPGNDDPVSIETALKYIAFINDHLAKHLSKEDLAMVTSYPLPMDAVRVFGRWIAVDDGEPKPNRMDLTAGSAIFETASSVSSNANANVDTNAEDYQGFLCRKLYIEISNLPFSDLPVLLIGAINEIVVPVFIPAGSFCDYILNIGINLFDGEAVRECLYPVPGYRCIHIGDPRHSDWKTLERAHMSHECPCHHNLIKAAAIIRAFNVAAKKERLGHVEGKETEG